ncbi:MAG: hypothetical protein H2174_06535 [Vampirovibrio sp.]|nr:hypothetical protein [Vampirovibrio sp.]
MGFSVKHIQAVLLVVLTLMSSGIVDSGIKSFADNSSNTINAKKTVNLPAGTALPIKITDTIDSKEIRVGTTVNFTATSDVLVDGVVVIKSGAMGQAQVSQVEEPSIAGQEGSVVVTDFTIRAIDGSRVPLTATLSQKGKDKMVVAIVSAIICLPFILIKGGKAVIPAGTQKTVYTAADTYVKL